jgi:glycine/sarcosine N-methyltransferase
MDEMDDRMDAPPRASDFIATEVAGFARRAIATDGTEGVLEAVLPDPRARLVELIDGVSSSTGERWLGEALLDRHLASLSEDFEPLMRGEKIEAPYDRVEGLVALFYGTLTDSYIGIDSHKPSTFSEVHPFLLDHLDSSLEHFPTTEACHGRRVVRVIRRTMKELREDHQRHKAAFRKYMHWHKDRAKLLRAEPGVVAAIQRKYRPTVWTTDIGLWPRTCALLFKPQISSAESIELQLYMRFAKETFDEVIAYVKDVFDVSNEIFLDSGGRLRERALTEADKEDINWSLEALFQPHLAARWADFVDSDVRLERKERIVVQGLLEQECARLECAKGDLKVFDSAMGVGTESVSLLDGGYTVESNEIDWTLISHARRYAKEKNVQLDLERHDWRPFKEKRPQSAYDVVLCLGNSLTCLRDKDEMVRAVRGLRSLLRPGGLLMIDERNYRDMWRRSDEMLGSDFLYEGTVMYCGAIKAKPLEILGPGETASLGYYDGDQLIGEFTVYCYDEGEFEEILVAAGFAVEATLWDLEGRESERAEFITYIARRVEL